MADVVYLGLTPNIVLRRDDDGERALAQRLELRNHSPTGFAWGYHGSGPAQLALAILTDALGDDQRALRLYQEFKARVVAKWRAEWSITRAGVLLVVEAIETDMASWGKRA